MGCHSTPIIHLFALTTNCSGLAKREIVGFDLLSLTVLGDKGRRSIAAKTRSVRGIIRNRHVPA
jgi:hypothetical protein